MCGRYLFDAEFEDIYQKLILFERDLYQFNGDIKPMSHAPVVVHKAGVNRIETMQWGLDGPEKGRKLINARSETLLEKRRYANLLNQRCLIPAKAFYEWETRGRERIQHQFALDHTLFLAGIYEQTHQGDVFAIITMAAEGDVKAIHDRMPVAVGDAYLNQWLCDPVGQAYEALLAQHPAYKCTDAAVQLSFF